MTAADKLMQILTTKCPGPNCPLGQQAQNIHKKNVGTTFELKLKQRIITVSFFTTKLGQGHLDILFGF